MTFSADGRRLAVGGGTFYGEGGLVLADLQSGEAVAKTSAELLPAAKDAYASGTISSLCFAADDRVLAASRWGLRWEYLPPVLFAVEHLHAQYVHQFADRRNVPWHRACATGVLLSGREIITRQHNPLGGRLLEISSLLPVSDPPDVLSTWPLPSPAAVASDLQRQRRTHHRLIVTRGSVITETGGSRGTVVPDGKGEYVKPAVREGLVARSLRDGTDSYIQVHGCRRISAICSLEPDLEFITGGRDGELDRWTWNGGWRQERLQDAQPVRRVDRRHWGRFLWVTYTPSSVVALAALPDPGAWLSVTAAGELARWDGGRPQAIWQIPVPGSPRALAVHPTLPLAAVGVKQALHGSPTSTVLIVGVG